MEDVDAIGELHAIFGGQIPGKLSVFYAAVVLQRLHMLTRKRVDANGAFRRQVHKVDPSFPTPDAVDTSKFEGTGSDVRVGDNVNVA